MDKVVTWSNLHFYFQKITLAVLQRKGLYRRKNGNGFQGKQGDQVKATGSKTRDGISGLGLVR